MFDKILDKIYRNTSRVYNKAFEQQDYVIADGLKKALLNLSKNDEKYKIKKFYFEGIFLDLTDRTVSHPKIRFARKKMETRSQIGAKMDDLLGFADDDNDIIWDLPLDGFNVEKYFESNWFHPSLLTYKKDHNELELSKIHYDTESINFFNYFQKRLEIYDICKPSDHIKYYEGIDKEKYVKELRKIFEIIL